MARIRHWVRNHSRGLGIGIFILTLILNNIFEFPRLWGQIPLGWVITVLLIVVLNLHLIPQYWAKVWIPIKYGFQLPNKDNYTCKNDYILPFTGRWCVWEGGLTKELSEGWSELIMRYAYFFVILDDNGNYLKSNDSTFDNNLCFGQDVLAASDGVVVKVSNKHSDCPDSKANNAMDYTGTSDVMGNHIVIRHNKNEYSSVGNLMRDSITVKVGDKVKQGNVIAKCGNSGYLTDEPCLHFQLQSSKSFNLSSSLPIAFTNIKAEDSAAYDLCYKNEGEKRPSTQGSLVVVGNKSYIGRGLDVENGCSNHRESAT